MVLVFWWILILGLLGVATLCWLAWRPNKREPVRIPVANADRLTGLPGYAKALARRRIWTGVLVFSALLLTLGALLAASRPASQQSSQPERENRDIVLCLDVSGSMVSTDANLVEIFSRLAKDFRGERLGLVIFDSSAVQVFPLTDDYEFVQDQLGTALKAMKDQSVDTGFFDGTFSGKGSSLIGDGLATCVNSFPKLGAEQRSRSIVLATDNLLLGKPLFSLDEAARLAAKDSIRVYGINPVGAGAAAKKALAAQQMRDAVELTGGAYYALENPAAAQDIVNRIQATEAKKIQGPLQFSAREQPEFWLAIAALGLVGLFVAAWRSSR